MALKAEYTIECSNCGKQETVSREKKPHERMPDFMVPPGWVELRGAPILNAEGVRVGWEQDHLCPECAMARDA